MSPPFSELIEIGSCNTQPTSGQPAGWQQSSPNPVVRRQPMHTQFARNLCDRE
jgi:hypothetical protein